MQQLKKISRKAGNLDFLYFTNLDSPEIKGLPFQFATFRDPQLHMDVTSAPCVTLHYTGMDAAGRQRRLDSIDWMDGWYATHGRHWDVVLFFLWYWLEKISIWVFPTMVGFPPHVTPQVMIIFRKTHGIVGETHHFRKSPYDCAKREAFFHFHFHGRKGSENSVI